MDREKNKKNIIIFSIILRVIGVLNVSVGVIALIVLTIGTFKDIVKLDTVTARLFLFIFHLVPPIGLLFGIISFIVGSKLSRFYPWTRVAGKAIIWLICLSVSIFAFGFTQLIPPFPFPLRLLVQAVTALAILLLLVPLFLLIRWLGCRGVKELFTQNFASPDH